MSRPARTLRDLSGSRLLRAELLSLASELARAPDRNATLRLVHPRMSQARIAAEWQAAAEALRPDLLDRLSLQLIHPDGRVETFGDPTGQAPPEPPRPLAGEVRLPRRDVGFAVEKVLIWAWLTGKGPLTRKWLEGVAGGSYPTVAAVVKRLGNAVVRHADRRIQLTHLPREEWARLFAMSGTARCTLWFRDASDQPSTAEKLLRRLQDLIPPGVALGGVPAAAHYDPAFDLVGVPRLDVSVHAPGDTADLSFVKRLDPALRPVTDAAAPVVLAIHFVRHREPLFLPASGGVPWVDPVECLLDLHEAGLDGQAAELRDALVSRSVVS